MDRWDGRPLSFRYAEINTPPAAKIPKSSDDTVDFPDSLIIELTGEFSNWLEVVFEQVNVTPDEPLAFPLSLIL